MNPHPFPLSAHQIAAAMGGDVTGRDSCNVPGPGHSRRDRSLAIRITRSGFVVHSFANDDWKECREYVRSKLDLSNDWNSDKAPPLDTTGDDLERRKKFAHLGGLHRSARNACGALSARTPQAGAARGCRLLGDPLSCRAAL